jgi:hypothetical protein
MGAGFNIDNSSIFIYKTFKWLYRSVLGDIWKKRSIYFVLLNGFKGEKERILACNFPINAYSTMFSPV